MQERISSYIFVNSTNRVCNIYIKKNTSDYLWCEHPEYKETWWEKLKSSSLEAVLEISLSRRVFSVKPARQYLKTVASDIGFLLLDVLLRAEFLASGLSESVWESSNSSRLSDLLTTFLT